MGRREAEEAHPGAWPPSEPHGVRVGAEACWPVPLPETSSIFFSG